MCLKRLLLSGAWTVLWGVQLCKPQWILGQLSRNSLRITSMLWNGKDVGFQVIKFSYKTTGQDLQYFFLYQKLQDSLITKSFNVIAVQKGCYKIDSNIAEKQAKERGRLNWQRDVFYLSINLVLIKNQLKGKLQCLKTFNQQKGVDMLKNAFIYH